jgi:two-component system cell cycle response regulator
MVIDDENTNSKPIISVLAITRGPEHPALTVLAGRDGVGRTIVLEAGEWVMGRAADAQVHIDDEGVSRHHARLVVGPDGVTLEDLRSKNGTLLNGRPIVATKLATGDRIQIGATTIFRFSYQDPLEAEAQRRLFDQATRDVLTGLYNRTFLIESMVKEFAFAKRHGTALSALFIDVDHFKTINDTWGHSAGDHTLKTLAALLNRTVRLEDVLGRYGGEEFVIVSRELTPKQALAFAERLRAAVEGAEFRVNAEKVPVTVSIGVATSRKASHSTWQDLVDEADRGLLKAKEQGRNRVSLAPKSK